MRRLRESTQAELEDSMEYQLGKELRGLTKSIIRIVVVDGIIKATKIL